MLALLTSVGSHAFAQTLPSAVSPAARQLVDDLAERWHLDHYDMQADLDSRDADSTVQHLSFLYGVSISVPVACSHFGVVSLACFSSTRSETTLGQIHNAHSRARNLNAQDTRHIARNK